MGEEGVRIVLGFVMAAALMACAPSEPQTIGGPIARVDDTVTATPPQTPPDTCGIEAHKHLIGVAETQIDRTKLPAGARVICPTCLVTQDYSENRLNLYTGTDGRVSSLRCG
jgi:hypothetical protein